VTARHTERITPVPLLELLPPVEVQQLVATLPRSTLDRGDLLFREGDPGAHLYLILSGQIEIVKALGTADERILGVRNAGEMFGEMVLINPDHVRTASVRARAVTELLQVSRQVCDEVLRRHPRLAIEVARVLSARLRESDNATICDLQSKNRQLSQAYQELQTAQAQLMEQERRERERQLAQERIEQELRIACEIQQTLLPKQAPALPGLAFAMHYQPARAVGGDFYDFLPLLDGSVGIVIGDVAGKGVPAALIMATTRSILRGLTQQALTPGQVLARANQLVGLDVPPAMFVTCFFMRLNPATGTMHFANAGHNLPYCRRGDQVIELRATGMPLGLLPDMHYAEHEARLLPGDSLVLYSDGLIEAHNPQREMFGLCRLQRRLADPHAGCGHQLLQFLLAELAQFTGPDLEQEDDITLVTVQRQA
jgi:serine phosphatase RsbU (regulator of sigma subunit)